MSKRSEIRAELLNELLAHFGNEHDEHTEKILANVPRGAFERGYNEGVWADATYTLEQLRGWDAEA